MTYLDARGKRAGELKSLSGSQDKNVTPKVVIDSETQANDWKNFFGLFKDFLAVGGDFV